MSDASNIAFVSGLSDLFALEHSLILTPNQRIAQQLQRQRDLIELTGDQESWLAPPVMTVSAWLLRLWENATAAGVDPCRQYWVLSPAEELELWRQAMLASLDTEFIAPESAAQQLMQAWQVICQWSVDLNCSSQRSAFQLNDNGAFFLSVCDHMLAKCKQIGAISASQIPGLLGELASPLSGQILLYGFEEVLPAHSHLLQQWQARWQLVQLNIDSNAEAQPLEVTRYPDFDTELQAAAAWAHRIVSNDAQARVAVIVPQLELRRPYVESCFERVFTPNISSPFARRQVAPFNISVGVSLASTPVIQAALTLLNWVLRPMPSTALPQLLYSPFLMHSYGLDMAALYQLEHRLRAYGDSELALGTILREAERICSIQQTKQPVDDSCILSLSEALTQARRLSRELGSAPFNDHLQCFQQQLIAAGWPGVRGIDSVEYQQLSGFNEALRNSQTLAALRFLPSENITPVQALKLLQEVLRAQVFQAQTSDSRVQILGMLEGAGLPFSHAHLCDFSLGQWPANPKPSPYIPYALQRQLRMPHCDAQRETEFAQRLLQRYRQQSQFLTCSVAAHDGQSDVLPSTLISGQFITSAQIDTAADLAEPSRSPPGRDGKPRSVSLQAVPLSEHEALRATSSVLTDQAACPFRAFARHRLHVRPFEPMRLGLDGRERGILLHDAMEVFWREARSSSSLKSIGSQALEALIEQSVDTAVGNARRRLRGRDSLKYLGVESHRLRAIIAEWLRYEMQREPFTVLDLECAVETTIAGRDAILRIDRVDVLDDGSLLLLEYKSGIVSEKDAMQAPVLAPQLALYLLRYRSAGGEQASGGAICRIDDQACGWIGAGRAKYTDMPLQRRLLKWEQDDESRAQQWSEQIEMWREQIAYLDQSFIAGEANTEPAKGLQTCRQCDYASVCRFSIDGAGA